MLAGALSDGNQGSTQRSCYQIHRTLSCTWKGQQVPQNTRAFLRTSGKFLKVQTACPPSEVRLERILVSAAPQGASVSCPASCAPVHVVAKHCSELAQFLYLCVGNLKATFSRYLVTWPMRVELCLKKKLFTVAWDIRTAHLSLSLSGLVSSASFRAIFL